MDKMYILLVSFTNGDKIFYEKTKRIDAVRLEQQIHDKHDVLYSKIYKGELE